MKSFFSQLLYVFPSKGTTLIPWFLAFLMSSILEVIGIGIIGPFIRLAENPEIIHANSMLDTIYKWLNFSQENQFITLIGFMVIGLFCIKSVISWYIQSRVFRFSNIQKEKLIERLLKAYLNAPYTLYISRNSAHIIQSCVNNTRAFADSIISTLMVASSNAITILAISLLLCIVSPIAVLSLLMYKVYGAFR
jgi:ABC-type multidrug transport system fused ATPase/permease subunit